MNNDAVVRKSNRAKQRDRKRTKEAVQYDPNPPRCGNCKKRKKEQQGIPGIRQYNPDICKTGRFPVTLVGVCDDWEGFDGSTIEK